MSATALAAAAAVWCWSVRAAPHLQQLPAAHYLCYACVVFTLAQPAVWCAVAGWVPDRGRHCALKFAAAEKITHLLVESATSSLAGADVPGVVRFRGLLDCAAALPLSEHASQNTFLMQFLRGLPEHLARGAGCAVLDLFDSSLAGALDRRAPACGTRRYGCSAAPVTNPRSTAHACSAAQGAAALLPHAHDVRAPDNNCAARHPQPSAHLSPRHQARQSAGGGRGCGRAPGGR